MKLDGHLSETVHRDCSKRLLVGLLGNLVLIPVHQTLDFGEWSRAGGLNEEMALIGGAIAAVILVLIARVYFCGRAWQQISALLLTPIPAIVVFVGIKYFVRGY